jgi:predicted Zn finger-like uncharacterized protein
MPSPSTFMIACPACQAQFRVPASLAGQTTNCPRCNQPIALPATMGEAGVGSGPPPIPVKPAAPTSRSLAKRRRDDDDDDDRDDDRYDDDDDRPRRRRLEPHRGTTILVLGIVSLFFAPIILGPMAWVMGNADLKQMREGRMDPEGKSNTEIGRVLGIISTCLGIAGIVFCCGFFMLIVALNPKR